MTAPPPRKISALVSDVDGSLVTRDNRITPEAARAVMRLRQAGLGFSLISSRPPRGLRAIVAALGVDAPVAGFNGAVIAGPDLAPIAERLLAPQTAHRAQKLLDARGIQIWAFSGQDWLVRDLEGDYVSHEQRTVQFAPTRVSSFGAALESSAKIVAVSSDFPALDACEQDLREALGDEANVVRSQDHYLDITHPRANKGDALAALARLMNIPLEEIAVIGDGANDVAMFARAGLSIAMGNAAPQVRARARFATDDNESNGFASAVARFVLPRAQSGAALEGGRR
jgi:Cof subfamily protein (haloacid dehalogenase superfamily)